MAGPWAPSPSGSGSTGPTGPTGPTGATGASGNNAPRFWPALGKAPALSTLTASTLTADGKYNAFPWVCSGRDGKLYAVYREGADHLTTDGKVTLQTSSDAGATWSAKTYIASPAAGHDFRTGGIVCTRTGRLVVNYFDENSSNAVIGAYAIYSDDSGATWSAPVALAGFTSWMAVGAAPVQHRSGVLVMPVYGRNIGDTSESVGVLTSTDDGATWGGFVRLGAANSSFTESSIIEAASGNLLAFIRKDGTDPQNTYLSTSTDKGVTWSAPSAIAGVSGVPSMPGAAIVPDNDAILLWYRQTGTASHAYRYSLDEGATWSAATIVQGGKTSAYAGGVPIAPTVLAFVYAFENPTGSTRCDVAFQAFQLGTSAQATIVAGVVSSRQYAGAADTFVPADAGGVVESTGAVAATSTLNSGVFPVGTVIELFQGGAGQVTITAGSGVTLRSDGGKVKTAGQYATVGLRQRAVDEWVLSGDLA